MSRSSRPVHLLAPLALFTLLSLIGITWGLPSRDIDRFLFGDQPPWPGEKIYALAGAGEKFDPQRAAQRGADVDVDPVRDTAAGPVLLTGTDEDVARIYLRYRLYTYQPDEMITMMALAGMNPRRLDLDPRLYQYGGLFIYPVGGLIGLCDLIGLIDVRGDVVYYLDHPDEFGKFYVVARAYAAAWGLIGVIIVYAIGRRLGGGRAGVLAALLFTLLPVVVCMAHEGKPHLPGAVLMLAAVLFAMRHLQASGGLAASSSPAKDQCDAGATRRRIDWWLMCICCGAAFGMVLSSWPIFVLIPLVVVMDRRLGSLRRSVSEPGPYPSAQVDAGSLRPLGTGDESGAWVGRVLLDTAGGVSIGVLVYLVTNPYIVINLFANREVLRSNFGNSLAMYEIARVGEGFICVLELTVEGATLPVLIVGVLALVVGLLRKAGARGSPTAKQDAQPPGGSDPAGAEQSGSDVANPGGDAAAAGAHGSAVPLRIAMLPLVVPAAVFFLQFVLIGAGKPAEYGRFGVFPDTALAIGAAVLLTRRWTRLRAIVNYLPAMFVAWWVAVYGGLYLWGFYADATGIGSRRQAAEFLKRTDIPRRVLVRAEPAPYSCPPLNFAQRELFLARDEGSFPNELQLGVATVHALDQLPANTGRVLRIQIQVTSTGASGEPAGLPVPDAYHWYFPSPDRNAPGGWLALMLQTPTPISWANKPLHVRVKSKDLPAGASRTPVYDEVDRK